MTATLMYQEAASAPQCVDMQLRENAMQMEEIGTKLRELKPVGGVTIARGSSDHAASYFAYLCMSRIGLPVASLPMSLTTLFNAPWQVERFLALAVSQSGQSTDLIETVQALRKGGAYTVSLINAEGAPLAKVSEQAIPLHAGPEKSVAATKSFITSLTASAQLIASWLRDTSLNAALRLLPDTLENAIKCDWQKGIDTLINEKRLIVIGRGPSLAVAQEAALKLKETCGMQAEPFSGAEVKHGPMALIEEGYPVLIFAPPGPEQKELIALAEDFRSRKAKVLLVADNTIASRDLTLVPAADFVLSPISVIQSFYIMAEALARARGLQPDTPQFLKKVTITQ